MLPYGSGHSHKGVQLIVRLRQLREGLCSMDFSTIEINCEKAPCTKPLSPGCLWDILCRSVPRDIQLAEQMKKEVFAVSPRLRKSPGIAFLMEIHAKLRACVQCDDAAMGATPTTVYDVDMLAVLNDYMVCVVTGQRVRSY